MYQSSVRITQTMIERTIGLELRDDRGPDVMYTLYYGAREGLVFDIWRHLSCIAYREVRFQSTQEFLGPAEDIVWFIGWLVARFVYRRNRPHTGIVASSQC